MKYGLIGGKLGHSFSREIHARIADYHYELCELTYQGVDALLKERAFKGINVTIPYKETVIPYLDCISENAKKIGAVNTIVNRAGKLYGYNTDYAGAKALIEHAGVGMEGKKALILGTGGTSKTLRTVAADMGAREICIVSRSPRGNEISYEDAAKKHADAQVIVNTTPVGMYPAGDAMPIQIEKYSNLSGVIDVIYNPLRTRLVLEAQKRNIPAEGGLYMLSAQAVYASALFTGADLDEALIERTYRAALHLKQNIVFIGMPTCGKTTIGEMLSRRMHREYLDTDAMIVQKQGRSIPEIFETLGENAFREMESQMIQIAAQKNGVIISTGGGAAMDAQNVEALRQNGLIVFLDRPLELLTATSDRPLSSSMEALKKRFRERYPTYCSVCDLQIENDGAPEETVERIMHAMGEGV